MPPASSDARLPPRSSAVIRPSQPPDRLRARSPSRHDGVPRAAAAVARRPGRRQAIQALVDPAHRLVEGLDRDRLALEGPARGDDLVVHAGHEPLGIGSGGRDRRLPVGPGPGAFLLGGPQRLDGPCLGRAGPLERVGRLCLGLLDRGEGRLEVALRLGQARAGVGDDRLGQAEALGDGERLAAAGQADREPIRRRERLEVELDRRVAGPAVVWA